MKLIYFPLRGLGEMARIGLSAAQVEWQEEAVDYQQMKRDLIAFPYGQCPKLVDGDLEIVQSNAIMRHIGRKCNMYGASEKETVEIDMVMDGIASLRSKYLELVYKDELAEDKKEAHWQTHGAPDSVHSRNGGAHWTFLNNALKKNVASGKGFIVGTKISIADCILFDLLDLYMRIYADQLKGDYPELAAYHGFLSEQAGVKDYLSSGKRPQKVNGNNMG